MIVVGFSIFSANNVCYFSLVYAVNVIEKRKTLLIKMQSEAVKQRLQSLPATKSPNPIVVNVMTTK